MEQEPKTKEEVSTMLDNLLEECQELDGWIDDELKDCIDKDDTIYKEIQAEDKIKTLIYVLLRECPQYEEWVKKNFGEYFEGYEDNK